MFTMRRVVRAITVGCEGVDNSAQSALPLHSQFIPEMGFTLPDGSEINTGGERWISNPA